MNRCSPLVLSTFSITESHFPQSLYSSTVSSGNVPPAGSIPESKLVPVCGCRSISKQIYQNIDLEGRCSIAPPSFTIDLAIEMALDRQKKSHPRGMATIPITSPAQYRCAGLGPVTKITPSQLNTAEQRITASLLSSFLPAHLAGKKCVLLPMGAPPTYTSKPS